MYMNVFKYSLLCCLFSLSSIACGSAPEKRNAEISVEYGGQVVYRAGGLYLDAESFKRKTDELQSKKETIRLIISAEWCAPCKYLQKQLKEKDLLKHVIFLNIDDPWVRLAVDNAAQHGALGGSKVPTLPFMIVEKPNGSNYLFQGPSQIIMHLINI
tara:strand:- start:912 stop:1382 length:471 start_codon:yes stop_codon:yes gene_type:complete